MGDVAGVVGAVAALIAAGAAVFAAWFTYHIMQAGQEQVKVSYDQFRQAVEAEQDARLPVLVPIQPLESRGFQVADNLGTYTQDTEIGYNREKPLVRVAIKNAGAGIALNVWGIVFEPEPEYEVNKETGQHHWHQYELPLEPAIPSTVDWKAGDPSISGDMEMTEHGSAKRHKLYAPPKPKFVAEDRGKTEKVARLTLTYSDIFGRKHAAIYDLAKQLQWENVDYLRNIKQDIGDLQRETRSNRKMYRAPVARTISPE